MILKMILLHGLLTFFVVLIQIIAPQCLQDDCSYFVKEIKIYMSTICRFPFWIKLVKITKSYTGEKKVLDHVKLRKIYQDSCLCCNFQHVVSNKNFKSFLLENLWFWIFVQYFHIEKHTMHIAQRTTQENSYVVLHSLLLHIVWSSSGNYNTYKEC